MEEKQFKETITCKFGFWPLDKNSDRVFIKNTMSLSVIYLLVEITDEGKIIVSERAEKTVIGDLKHYDKIIFESDLADSKIIDRIEATLNSYN